MEDKEKALKRIIELVNEMPLDKARELLSFAEGMAAMKKIMENDDEDDK